MQLPTRQAGPPKRARKQWHCRTELSSPAGDEPSSPAGRAPQAREYLFLNEAVRYPRHSSRHPRLGDNAPSTGEVQQGGGQNCTKGERRSHVHTCEPRTESVNDRNDRQPVLTRDSACGNANSTPFYFNLKRHWAKA